ncbi:MAG: methylated-DNA--[protein]-cysteine S-methyltransferase [Prevotella sp.]
MDSPEILQRKEKATSIRLVASPFGFLKLASRDGRLCLCQWHVEPLAGAGCNSEEPVLREAERQLNEYFNRSRTSFALPLFFGGTVFQQMVWNALANIPYGSMVTYAWLARAIGRPKAVRAVARACHDNPLGIILPCHRVIGSNGKLVGYAGGLETKRCLLQLEQQVEWKEYNTR